MKKIIKTVFCEFVYRTGLLGLFIRIFLSRRSGLPGVALIYHHFSKDINKEIVPEPTITNPIESLGEDLEFLTKYFDVVSMDEYVNTLKSGNGFSKPTVTITVDDGVMDNYDLMFPVLKKYDVPVIIYITTGYIGTHDMIWADELGEIIKDTEKKEFQTPEVLGKNPYLLINMDDKRVAYDEISQSMKDLGYQTRLDCLSQIRESLGAVRKDKPFMLTWEHVREMNAHNVSFGAHTVTHPILSRMPAEDAKREILESKQIIEKNLGVPCRHFAYPNGRLQDFTEDLLEYCKDIGFESVSKAVYGNNSRPEDVWTIERMGCFLPVSLFAVNLVRCFLGRRHQNIQYGINGHSVNGKQSTVKRSRLLEIS